MRPVSFLPLALLVAPCPPHIRSHSTQDRNTSVETASPSEAEWTIPIAIEIQGDPTGYITSGENFLLIQNTHLIDYLPDDSSSEKHLNPAIVILVVIFSSCITVVPLVAYAVLS